MKAINGRALAFSIIAGINGGLAGQSQFDLVAAMFSWLSQRFTHLVNVIFGPAALYVICLLPPLIEGSDETGRERGAAYRPEPGR
jgi:uncharacterized membrane protein YuzA (DUF378 family)